MGLWLEAFSAGGGSVELGIKNVELDVRTENFRCVSFCTKFCRPKWSEPGEPFG